MIHFLEHRIKLVMESISTSRLSFLLNGSLICSVVPSRCLIQGFPISPYLFLLCAEALSCLIAKLERNGRILDKYLGLPTLVGRNKLLTFNEIKERVWKKVCSWKGDLFSFGGKEVLIKAVAQAIPTYTMSIFQLPKGISQLWLLSCLEDLHLVKNSPPERPSTFKPITPDPGSDLRVAALINSNPPYWNLALLNQNFLPVDREAIISIPLSFLGDPDSLTWQYEKSGVYTVKSGYTPALTKRISESVSNLSSVRKWWSSL
ncbi:hypothetical protein Dsin_005574 [Dipteronia sinensis]|uniref:Reverse transcriptase domain-containing protein n=1 Tax=Dipteronia sinensis TaxID=43782 RepID=A0AAE0EFC2_9ROSI|nr:hypothetical protein Dsin_005574 [Dipteronia sinensis]